MDVARRVVRRSPLLRSAVRHTRRVLNGPADGRHWVRIEMDKAIAGYIDGLGADACDAVEVSGRNHGHWGWRSYTRLSYPDYDLAAPSRHGPYDVVLCEQVLEHVATLPHIGFGALAQLCRPGGHLIVSTPFIVRVHTSADSPHDLWRFSPEGVRLLLEDAGMEVVEVGSWGNAWCTFANRNDWKVFRPWHRVLGRLSLANDPRNPQVVWAFARRPVTVAEPAS